MGDEIQMLHLHAEPVPAEVVDLHAGRDGPVRHFPCQAVGIPSPVQPVAGRVLRTLPLDALTKRW